MRPIYWEIPPKREWQDGKVTIVAVASRRVIATMAPRPTALSDGRLLVRMNNDRVKVHLALLLKHHQPKELHAQAT